MDTPVAVDDLRHTEVHADRHEGDRLILTKPLRRHQEMAVLPATMLDIPYIIR